MALLRAMGIRTRRMGKLLVEGVTEDRNSTTLTGRNRHALAAQ